jgi:hypothetical protein
MALYGMVTQKALATTHGDMYLNSTAWIQESKQDRQLSSVLKRKRRGQSKASSKTA